MFSGGREWVCARAEGEVLEIAVGTGRNLPHYPDDVRLTGIDSVPAMLDVARRRAVELGRPVDSRLGDGQALEFEDATFDTVVCTLSLCTIPDDRAAVAEVRRVLRPSGRFVLLEHVRSPFCVVADGAATARLLLRELKDPERKSLTGPDGLPRRSKLRECSSDSLTSRCRALRTSAATASSPTAAVSAYAEPGLRRIGRRFYV